MKVWQRVWGNGVPPFNPATLNLGGRFEVAVNPFILDDGAQNFVWQSTPSAGVSATNDLFTANPSGNKFQNGVVLNGFQTLRIASNTLALRLCDRITHLVNRTFLSQTDAGGRLSMGALVKISSIPNGDGTSDNDPMIWGAYRCVDMAAGGVGKNQLETYNYYDQATRILATPYLGSFCAFMATWDPGIPRLRFRINALPFVTSGTLTGGSPTTNIFGIGNNATNCQLLDAAGYWVAPGVLSDADLNGYLSYWRTTYGLPLT